MNKTLWQHVVISQSLSQHWSSCSKNKVEPKLQSRRVVCLSSLQPLLLHHCFLTILHLETETHYCSTLHKSLCVCVCVCAHQAVECSSLGCLLWFWMRAKCRQHLKNLPVPCWEKNKKQIWFASHTQTRTRVYLHGPCFDA